MALVFQHIINVKINEKGRVNQSFGSICWEIFIGNWSTSIYIKVQQNMKFGEKYHTLVLVL